MTSDRAVLEAIAFGNDPDLRPADRLRALELLRQIDSSDAPALEFARSLLALDDDALDEEIDASTTALLTLVFSDEEQAARYPRSAAFLKEVRERAIREEVERRSDLRAIEAEIERRAEERAHELYAARPFVVLEGGEEAAARAEEPPEREPAPAEAETIVPTPRGPQNASNELAPGMLPGWELERGWPDERRRVRPLR